jgi:hypothetical protein
MLPKTPATIAVSKMRKNVRPMCETVSSRGDFPGVAAVEPERARGAECALSGERPSGTFSGAA